jgi:hypothetical protein
MFDDARDNLHDLPAELLSAHQAVERLGAEVVASRTARPDLAAVERKVTDGYLTAARNGKAWPDVATIREARTAVGDHDLRSQVLDRAQTEASAELLGLIHDHADAIITNCLRPAFDRLVAAFTVAASVLPESPSVDALMRASDKVRKTWLSLDDDVHKHARITSTAVRLTRLNPPVHDVEGEFASLLNVRDIWPDYGVGRTPPWENTDPRLTRLSIIRAGGQMWLPTPAERDAAWLAKHGERVEQVKANRFALEGFRAVGG